MTRRALFLSPHLDDVAFSCGGTLHVLGARGWDTTLCTVFTRSVTQPTGFALACQLDKGLGPEVDYLALRRAEDDRAAMILRATRVERLDFPEAPHRGYENAAALFAGFVASDDVAPALTAIFVRQFGAYDAILAPQALGNHVDHRRVRNAVLEVARRCGLDDRVLWYRDAPYAIREPDAEPSSPLAESFAVERSLALDAVALDAKVRACAAYASQIAFQFGGAGPMARALDDFAVSEGARSGSALRSERFRSTGRESESLPFSKS